MKVSVVTISFNQASFLEQAVQSVISQEYKDIEYIVVDPGSTDGSRDLIERYRDKISRVIYDPDKGPADGLNKGFSLAQGDIYGFLNADDFLLPGALAKVVGYFQDHPDVDIVSGHANIVAEDGRIIRRAYSEPFNLRRYAFGCSITMQPSTFIRSRAFKKTNGFNSSNHSNWDGELWVDMAIAGCQFEVMDEFLSAYRLQPNSITSSTRLDSVIKEYRQRIFTKIIGRPYRNYDVIEAAFWRGYKHLRSPKALWARLIGGPIYGRKG